MSFSGDTTTLTLTNNPASGKPYRSGEYRTEQLVEPYGYYSVDMKAAPGAGLMSSFFTYTGSTDGQQHDENDIVEILGLDPYTLRTNFWINDVTHEEFIPLSFDATADFHNYALEWLPNSLRWYVDGQLVREYLGQTSSIPQRILINLWAGDAANSSWMGSFNYTQPVSAQYKNYSYQPAVLSDGTNALTDESGNTLGL